MKYFSLLVILVLGFALPAQATLEGRLPATPGGTDYQAYYDTDLDITWAADANINGPDAWDNQVAWAASLTIGGVSGWRLPMADPSCGTSSFNCTTSEMGYMYYTELGNAAGGPLTNTGPFTNLEAFFYWSGTESLTDPLLAWDFRFFQGVTAEVGKANGFYAWAVHDGDVAPPGPEFSCIGFDSPFDSALTIKKKAKGTIPVKMKLFDENNFEITGADVSSPPVINVTFNGFVYGDGATDDDVLESVGSSNEGNIFAYHIESGYWEYRVGTKQFPAAGIYTVDARSGDEEEYTINPSCSQTFTRLP